MAENNNQKFIEFLKKILTKIRPRFSFHYVAYTTLFIFVIFSVVSIVTATTPNPGHPWAELGDGVFTVANTQTANRTYTFPDANATVLTTNALVTVAQGGTGVGTLTGLVKGNGTGAFSAAVSGTDYQAPLVSGTNIKTINGSSVLGSGNLSIDGMVYPGSGIPNSTGSAWGTSYTTTGSGTALVLSTTPTFTTNITTPLVLGGSTTTSPLTFQTTSGVGTTGADMHFKVGNNGGTEALTILNNGNVGVGTIAPRAKFEIGGSFTMGVSTVDPNYSDIWATGVTPSGTNYNLELANNGTEVTFNVPTGGIMAWTTNNGWANSALYINNNKLGAGMSSSSTPTAKIHIGAGTATAGTAPLKFTSGTLLTTTEAGAIEFNNDAYYGTITTGAGTAGARKQFAFTSDLTTGYVPYTGASSNVNLGTYNLTTGSEIITKSDSTALTDLLINPTAKTSGNFIDAQVNGASKFVMDYKGYIGMGRGVSSIYALTLLENKNGDVGFSIKNSSSGASAYANNQFENDLGDNAYIGISGSGAGSVFARRTYLEAATGLGLSLISDTGDIRLYTGGSTITEERMRIDATGNVGIGTTAPGAKLDISSSILTADTTENIQRFKLIRDTKGSTVYGNIGFSFLSADDGNGQVDAARIQIKEITSGIFNSNLSGSAMSFWTNTGSSGQVAAQERMTIASNGYVGIGTTIPTSRFSVGSTSQFQVNSSGNIVSLNGVATSFPASNSAGVLTNNGSGTLTWEAPAVSSQWTTTGSDIYYNTGRAFIGSTTETTSVAKLALTGTTAVDGSVSGVIGVLGNYTFNPTVGGVQVGNRFVVTNSPTSVANTAVGETIRIVDNSGLANLVRGVDITSNAGSNTSGINTALRASGATFGIQATTSGLAGGTLVPAALYGENTCTAYGNVLRLYSNTMTSAPSFATFYHDTSAFTGTGLLMNFATGSGSFSGNFVDFQNNNTSLFKVTNAGITSLGLGGTASTNAVCSSLANGTAPTAGVSYELRDCSSSPIADYAEMYPVEKGIEFGDVVATGTEVVKTYDTTDGNIDWNKEKGNITKLTKSNKEYQENVIGIVSNNYGDFTSTGNNIKEIDNPMPIALSGRVPVKISSSSEPIKAGDYLTTGTDIGKAIKATKSGFVIGKALENWNKNSDKNTIMVFVEQGYHNGEEMVNLIKEMNLSLDATSGNINSTLDSNGEPLKISFFSNIFSKVGIWFADKSNGIGDFFANKVHTKEICVAKSDGTEFCANGDQLESMIQMKSQTSISTSNNIQSPQVNENSSQDSTIPDSIVNSGVKGEDVVVSDTEPSVTPDSNIPPTEDAPKTVVETTVEAQATNSEPDIEVSTESKSEPVAETIVETQTVSPGPVI
jgi:hypothetical protein